MKTSAPTRASLSVIAWVSTACFALNGLRSVRSFRIVPFVSHIVTSTTPAALSMSQMRMPAAPAPFMTTLRSLSALPASFAKFMTPESEMTAVPHWSSWKTGMSSSRSSVSSISKQAGEAMSSRLTPPYCGAIILTASITRFGSVFPVFLPSMRQ